MVSGSHIEKPVMRLSSLAYCGAYRGSFQPHLFFYRVGSSGMFQINGAGGLGENSTGDISVASGDSCIFPITLRGAASSSEISQKPAHGKLKKLNVATYEYKTKARYKGNDTFAIRATGKGPRPSGTSVITVHATIK
ncbi:hypothetical protein ABIF68_008885 [Bradyrhizobium japonicum]|jgi:hypothetical protein